MTDRRRRKSKEPGYLVPALERGLLMLQAFSRDEPVESLGELARELDMPRATVFRLADTLEHLGFLVRDPDTGEYRIGAAALQLGWNYLSSSELPDIAHPYLAQLRHRVKASVHMAVRDGREIVYISRLPVNAALTSNIRVGSRLPAHATSMGRALLQDLDAEELSELYRGLSELAPFSPETPTTVEQLLELVEQDSANGGLVISRGFYEKGVISIAAPIRDGAGRVVAAINITAPAGQYTDEQLSGSVMEDVLDVQKNISMALGWDPETGGSAPPLHRVLPQTALVDPRYEAADGGRKDQKEEERAD
jgi:DNA-binding IclR family transcriptional regulator